MSYFLLNVIHILGVLFVFIALGGTLLHVINGGTKDDNNWQKPMAMIHGIGMLVILIAGLWMVIHLGFKPSEFPGWVWAKLLIWLFFGAAIVLPFKAPQSAKALVFVLPLIGALAAYLAVFKPF